MCDRVHAGVCLCVHVHVYVQVCVFRCVSACVDCRWAEVRVCVCVCCVEGALEKPQATG
jgi:hypothetical protein